MNKQTTGIVIGVVLIIAVALGVIVATQSGGSDTKSSTGMTMNDKSSSSASSDSGGKAVATDSVDIKDYMFTPMAITVKVGTTVTWTNKDAVGHTVTADTPSSDAPDGPLINQNQTYKFTFNKAGAYSIHCMPHPYMKATVTVTE